MATLLMHHSCFANHQTGYGHPERPDRYRAVQAVLDRPEFDPLVREEAELADLDSTRHVHSNRYVDGLATWAPDDPAIYDAIGKQRASEGYLTKPFKVAQP